MYKIIIFILLSAISLNAAEITWVNAFPIYVYGDVTAIAKVYEFINNVVADPSVHIIIGIGVTMAIVISGWKLKDGDYNEIIKALFAPITLYALFFVPTVNVHITDLRVDKGLINYSVPDGGYRKVDNVPYMIAFIPASASTLVSLFIDLIDNSWDATSTGSKFSTLGFQEMSHISQEALILGTFNNLDVNSSSDVYNMQQYVHQCLVIEALKVPSNHQKLIKPSKTFPEMYDPANFDGNISNVRVTFTDATGVTEVSGTCATLYTTYVSGVASALESDFGDVLQGNFPNVDTSSATFNEAWRENAGVDQIIVGNIRKAMITGAASRALAKDLSTDGIGVDGVAMATEIAIEKTIANLRTEGLAKYEWMARMLPNAVFIIMMLMLGIFPLMIIVMTFMGFSAFKGVANFFMGYIAMNFNLVSLALVSNIISYYTAQNAQNAIVSYAGMPFGSTQISEFMYQQADMAGLAGIIGAISVPFVTAAIFYGETKGLAAGISGVTGAFRGNVAADAKDTLVDRDAQQEIDKQMLDDAQHERDAAAWLTNEGFPKPSNMSAVEAKNQMMKNLSSIGNANAASEIFHSGNAQNFISGSAKQSSQNMNKTAGFGDSSVSMETAGSVSFEDGEVMGSMIQKTSDLRSESESYDTSKVGEGQAIGMFGKDMGSAALADLDSKASATVANATNAVANQVGAGQGLLETGAFNSDGTLANNSTTAALIKGAALSSAQKASAQIGTGETGKMEDFLSTALQDGHIAGFTPTKVAERRADLDGSNNPNTKWDAETIASGNAISSVHKETQAQGTHNSLEKEKGDLSDAFRQSSSGSEEMGRKSENSLLGTGKEWDKRTATGDDIKTMSKMQDNAAVQEFGGIDSTHAEIMKHGSLDGAIKDMVTVAQEKGIQSSEHAENLRDDYGSNLDSKKMMKMSSQDRSDLFDAALNEKDPQKKQAMLDMLDEANQTGGVSRSLRDVTDSIDQSKLDSQLGQAIGIDQNKIAGVNYSQNAMYGEMSSQQSTQAKLDAQGGVEGAVKVDATDASIKAKTQEEVLDSQLKQAGAKDGLDSSIKELASATDKLAKTAGTLAGGKTAADIATTGKFDSPEQFAESQAKTASQQASKDKAKMLLDEDQEANNGLVKKALMMSRKGYEGEQADEKEAQALDQMERAGLVKTMEDGSIKVATGTKFSDAMAVLNSGDMGRDKQVQIAGTSMNIDRDMDGNTRITGTSLDSTERGSKLDYSVSGFAGAVGVGLAMGAAGLATANQYSKHMASEKIPMKMEDMHGAKPDGNGGFIDSNGKGFGLNENGEVTRNGKVAMKDNPNYKKGFIKAGWDNAKNSLNEKGKDLRSSFTSEPLDETISTEKNQTANENANSSSNSNKNDVSHKKSPDINSNTIIPKSSEVSKVEGVNSRGKLHQFNPNHKTSREAFLQSNPGAHSNIKPSGTVLDNQGFFEKRMNALSSVWDGGGSFKTKLAMSAGAMALGSVSATASDLMDAVDPVAHVSGTSLGDSSYGGDELKQMQAQFKASHPGVAPAPSWIKGIQPVSTVPQHVQTAFSTPSGFNTQQAISTSTGFSTNAAGQEIYGANKNDTLFKNDTSAESLRIQEDIALGTEFNQETSEGIQAAVERLMDADRNETKE